MIAAEREPEPCEADEREARCRALLPLVSRLANGLAHVFTFVECEELFGDGCIGMVRAVDSYDPARGIPLEHYARPIIAGAIMNGVRARDPLSEHARRILRAAERERETARGRGEDEPTLAQLRTRVAGLASALLLEHRARTVSLDAPLPDGKHEPLDFEADPLRTVEATDAAARLRAAIDALPDRQRSVVDAAYYRKLPANAIARELAISSQRVGQLHERALANLRRTLPA